MNCPHSSTSFGALYRKCCCIVTAVERLWSVLEDGIVGCENHIFAYLYIFQKDCGNILYIALRYVFIQVGIVHCRSQEARQRIGDDIFLSQSVLYCKINSIKRNRHLKSRLLNFLKSRAHHKALWSVRTTNQLPSTYGCNMNMDYATAKQSFYVVLHFFLNRLTSKSNTKFSRGLGYYSAAEVRCILFACSTCLSRCIGKVHLRQQSIG